MFRNFLTGAVIACAVVFGSSTGAFAQTTDAHQDADKAGKEAKAAAKEAGAATKDAAKATAKGTKKVAKKVKRAVTPHTTSATCKDGTVQKGKTKTTACVNHGGVQG
jgi:hypothetical protein